MPFAGLQFATQRTRPALLPLLGVLAFFPGAITDIDAREMPAATSSRASVTLGTTVRSARRARTCAPCDMRTSAMTRVPRVRSARSRGAARFVAMVSTIATRAR